MSITNTLTPVQGESRTAYPNWLGSAEDSEPGIDTLAYFAARAPKEPLWFFEPVGMPPRPKCIRPASQTEDGEPEYDGDVGAWEQAKAVARYAQWPWVWARAVLRAEVERLTAERGGAA